MERVYRLELSADQRAITEASEWAQARAAECNMDADTLFAVQLCVEETVTNVVTYAFDTTSRPPVIALSAWYENARFRVEVMDNGTPFDPISMQSPGREGTIENATIGGRGLRLIRAFTKAIEYRHDGEFNRFTLTF